MSETGAEKNEIFTEIVIYMYELVYATIEYIIYFLHCCAMNLVEINTLKTVVFHILLKVDFFFKFVHVVELQRCPCRKLPQFLC